MSDKIDIEKLLTEYPERAEYDPHLADEAAERTRELYGKSKPRKTKLNRWQICALVSACCACAVVGIVVPIVYKNNNSEIPPVINYYGDRELTWDNIPNIESFISENNYRFYYFSDAYEFKLYSVIETSKPVIVEQQYICMDEAEEGLDLIQLDVCLTNDIFIRYEQYDSLTTNRVVGDISLQYSVTQGADGLYEILAKCEVDSYRYYWTISSTQGEERLDYYITSLFA